MPDVVETLVVPLLPGLPGLPGDQR